MKKETPILGSLNHVAIAVPVLADAIKQWQEVLGAEVSAPQPMPEHGVTVVFIQLPNAKIELLEPLGEQSPIAKFLERNPKGGIHHLCLETSDVTRAIGVLKENGAQFAGTDKPSIGAHGKPVVFLHPQSTAGILLELEEKV